MIEFVKKMDLANKIIGTICHAGWMLASADFIKGKKMTSFFSIRDDMVHAGAKWVDQEMVKDGNLITSRHRGDLPAFCKMIIKALS
jgi:protease I